MGCSACSAGAFTGSNNYARRTPEGFTGPCGLTKEILQTWRAALKCVKQKGKQAEIGLALSQVNQMAGFIQSALNYPDNYCYYYEQLQYFQEAILPQIVTNVPECINQ